MIYAECIVIDLKTQLVKGRYYQTFETQDNFNKWYAIVKTDYDTAINFMRYNFYEKPGLKATRDARLARVPRVALELST